MATQTTQGIAPFSYNGELLETWYRVYGDLKSDKSPLLVLHGGPGLSHDYMLPLADLASGDHARPVILYDQVGNGRSSLLDKPETFWTIDLFVEEILNLVRYLGVQNAFDVLGHSWGGMLAAELIIRRQPAGLKHVVLADTLFSRVVSDNVIRLRGAGVLSPQEIDIFMKGRERETSHPQYPDISKKFLSLFGTRVSPLSKLEQFPAELATSIQLNDARPDVLNAMRKHEINSGWDISAKLSQINLPTLIVFGHFDFLMDSAAANVYLEKIPNAKLVEFMDSSHVPHWEQRDAYMQVVRNFLEDGGGGI